MSAIEIMLGVGVLLAIVLHFIPSKDIHSAAIQKAQQDVDDLYEWVVRHLERHPEQMPAPAQAPAPAVATPVVPVTPLALDPVVAVTRYIAGGMTTAVGMPNLYELQWLYAQPKAAQVAWGTAVAQAFDKQLAPVVPPADLAPNATFTANTETVGQIPVKMRTEAASYLFAVGGGFPNVGKCDWTLA